MSLYTIIDQTKPFPSIKVNSVSANSFTADSFDATTMTLSGTINASSEGIGTLYVPDGGIYVGKDLYVQGKIFASNYSGPTGQSLLTGISYVVGVTAFPTSPYYSYVESNGIVTLTIMGYSGIIVPTTGYIQLNLASTIPSPDMVYELTTSIVVANVAQPTRALLLPGGSLVMYYIYSDSFVSISGTINFYGMTFTYKKA